MKTCNCGNNRLSHDVSEVPEYSNWSIFLISMGISAKPIKVEYTCNKCKKTFDALGTDELKHWVT
jgi:hypothetical protein